MLGLVTIFLATFLIAALAVWVYRLLFGWSYKRVAVVGPQRPANIHQSAQQGEI